MVNPSLQKTESGTPRPYRQKREMAMLSCFPFVCTQSLWQTEVFSESPHLPRGHRSSSEVTRSTSRCSERSCFTTLNHLLVHPLLRAPGLKCPQSTSKACLLFPFPFYAAMSRAGRLNYALVPPSYSYWPEKESDTKYSRE